MFKYIDLGASSDKISDVDDIEPRNVFVDEVRSVARMTPLEDFYAVCFFLFGVPGFAFTFPATFALTSWLSGSFLKTGLISVLLLSPLVFSSVKFDESSLSSPLARLVLRYFSVKVIYMTKLKKNVPTILVTPPHGVFPFGNLLAMLALPDIMGFSIRGLGASSIFWTPVFRQIMGTIGVIDASKASAKSALEQGFTIGISSGGVTEVFETNEAEQTVVLKDRKGFVKLAFQTGADIVPCYVFGNTETLSMFAGGGGIATTILRHISRKIGLALIFFWGRFGLPVPYRVPLLLVFGEPIPCALNESPSREEIDEKHALFLRRLRELFDKYKSCYGWGGEQLIIV